jgi:hypothetical protein
MQVLVTEQDFYGLATAYFTQAAAQNVRYAEIFFDPPAHTSRGVKFGTVLRGLRRAVVDARRTRDLHAWLIMCLLRDCSAEYAMATPMESPPYKDWIVGVGLDSDERGNPPVEFEKVFARARAEGYLLTMHCDVDQPGTLDHIRAGSGHHRGRPDRPRRERPGGSRPAHGDRRARHRTHRLPDLQQLRSRVRVGRRDQATARCGRPGERELRPATVPPPVADEFLEGQQQALQVVVGGAGGSAAVAQDRA